jgi:hypothetical protein
MGKQKKIYVIAGLLLAITGIIGYVAYRTRLVPTPKKTLEKI